MGDTMIKPETKFGAPSVASKATPKQSRHLTVSVMLQITAMVGIGALVYPSSADWFATLNHNSEVSGYVQEVEQLPEESRLEKLQIANDYNSHMPSGVLRDPYSDDTDDRDLATDAAYQSYLEVLRVSGNGVIGEISYPNLGISLPVYHGTSDEVLSSGAGHLYGSSLPVGGTSTHSVLTSHSGLLRASLFTKLPEAQIGDTFQVTVLGETRYYEVDGFETVEPFVTDSLSIMQNEDRVTLVTCTPIGINSHRLLVHGIRVAAPEGVGMQIIAGGDRTAGVPWWAIVFLGGSAVTAYLLFIPPSMRKRMRGAKLPDGSQNHSSSTADFSHDNNQEARA